MPATDPDLEKFLASGPEGRPGLIPDVLLPALFHADQAARQLPAAAAVADEHGVENLPSATGTVDALLRFLEEAINAARRADEATTVEVLPRMSSVARSLFKAAHDGGPPLTRGELLDLWTILGAAIGWAENPEAMALADKVR